MTIAAQLRVAIALLIAVLLAILLAAFYVPAQLQRSANEKYVEDAIPLRYYVHDLALQTARQQAAVEAYLRTREPALLERYYTAADTSNFDLARMRPLLPNHRRMFALLPQGDHPDRRASGRPRAADRRDSVRGRPRRGGTASRRCAPRFAATVDAMIAETDAFVADAEREQRDRYRQLLFVLASLGVSRSASGWRSSSSRAGWASCTKRNSGLVRRPSRARTRARAAHVSDGVILTDSKGRARFWNPGAEKLTGIDEDGAIGRELSRLLPGWERLARQPEAQSGFGGAAVLPIQLDRERWLSVMSVDFGDGVVYAVRDVTEERALETLRSDFVATASHELERR